MTRHLPPLNALRAFEVCSRKLSFTQAAQELSISQGAVSRHISLLEEFLQVQLFERGHRQVTLTREGEMYAIRMQSIFASISAATDEITRKPERCVVRILLFPTVAARWLMPRIHSFHEAHPDIDLEVRTSALPGTAEMKSVDAYNMRGPVDDPALDYHPIFDIELRPVCSPRLLNGKVSLKTPDDLRQHVLLHSLNRVNDWKIWFERAGVGPVPTTRGLEFDNTSLAFQAAMNAAGVAMGIGDILDTEIASDRLVEPFQISVRTGETYGIAWRKDRVEKPGFAEFRTWLKQQSRPLPAHRLESA